MLGKLGLVLISLLVMLFIVKAVNEKPDPVATLPVEQPPVQQEIVLNNTPVYKPRTITDPVTVVDHGVSRQATEIEIQRASRTLQIPIDTLKIMGTIPLVEDPVAAESPKPAPKQGHK